MRRAWRPVAVALILAGGIPLAASGRGQADDSPDPVASKSPTRTELVGSASARVAAAGPILGGLNLEAGFARSTVELTGDAARGESATMSAGAASLFLTLSGTPPVLPEPTRAGSNGDADAERSLAAPAGDFVRVGHERVHAEPRRSEAVTSLGNLTVGDAATVSGGASTATISAEGSRSSSVVGELRLGGANGPAVVLSGLGWWAEQPKGAPAQAAFWIGAATIGGQPFAVGSPEEVAAAIRAVNGVLGSQGIRISPPVVTAGAEGGHVAPLRIELRDPPLNRAVAGAAYSPLAPTVNQAQEAAVQASGSDPRASQALLGANLGLSLLLGNGGVGVELGGAMAGLTTREVPDLGSLFGGSTPPLAGGDSEQPIALGGGVLLDGVAGSDGSSGFASGPFESGNTSANYGSLPPGGTVSEGPVPGSDGPAAPATPEVALGTGQGRRPQPEKPGHLPAPLAATALATGLAIVSVDWLARRRTVGVVGGLRAAAGLAAAVGRPAGSPRSLLAAGVALVTVLALALAPSRVPLPSGGGDEVAAVSPIPPLSDEASLPTGVPSDSAAPGAAAAAGATGAGSGAAGAQAGARGVPPPPARPDGRRRGRTPSRATAPAAARARPARPLPGREAAPPRRPVEAHPGPSPGAGTVPAVSSRTRTARTRLPV